MCSGVLVTVMQLSSTHFTGLQNHQLQCGARMQQLPEDKGQLACYNGV